MTTTTLRFTDTSSLDTPATQTWADRILTGVFLVILMAFAAAISWFSLAHQSLRLDEAQSLWQTSASVPRMLQLVGGDVHVPFYHVLLHFWQVLFGNSISTARILSLVFFLLTIPATYMLGKRAYDRSVGLFAALLLTVSPFLNWYGNEARMYSLMTLITVLNQFFFLGIYKRNTTGQWWGYVLTALAGIFTHYFFWFVLLTQAIFYFFQQRKFAGNTLKRLIGTAILLVVAISPWIWYVLHLQGIGMTSPHLTPPTTVNLFNTFSQFLFGFQDDHLNTLIVSLWPVSVLFGFLTLSKIKKVTPATVYFILAATVPVVAAFIVSVTLQPLFLTRYLILAVPALYLFIGWMLSVYPPRLSAILKIAVVVGMIFTLVHQTTASDTPVKEDFRAAAEYVTTQATAQDVVIVSAPFSIYPVEYYYRGPAQLTTLPVWDRTVTGAIPTFSPDAMEQEVNSLKTVHRRAYVLLSYDQGYQQQVQQYFETHYQRLEHKEFSPGLDLYVYQLRYDPQVEVSGK